MFRHIRSIVAIPGLMGLGATPFLGGCVSGPAMATINMHSRVQYSRAIDNMFVAIKVDNMPGAFGYALPTALHNALELRGVRNIVRAVSDLDLQTVSGSEVSSFRYVMSCRPSNIEKYQNTVNVVTLNCAVVDMRAQVVVLRADIRTIRGVGFVPFGAKEAERATAELVGQMQSTNLLAPASNALSPITAQYTPLPVPPPPPRVPGVSQAAAPVAVPRQLSTDQEQDEGRVTEIKVLPDGTVQRVRGAP